MSNSRTIVGGVSLTDGQRQVLRAFHSFGDEMDDQRLIIWTQQTEDRPLSSSGIRTRRSELMDRQTPLIEQAGTKVMRSGRNAATHVLTAEGERIAKHC